MPETQDAQSYLDPATILAHLQITPGQKVGDFGVGGAAPFAFALSGAVGPEGSVVMFDILKTALSAALTLVQQRGLKNCQAVWSNLEIYNGASGVADGSFDAGILVNVLHQSNKHQDILAEVGRMLKPKAKLLIVEWKHDADSTIAPDEQHRLADGYVEQMAQGLGFAALEKFEAGPYHWGMVLVKA